MLSTPPAPPPHGLNHKPCDNDCHGIGADIQHTTIAPDSGNGLKKLDRHPEQYEKREQRPESTAWKRDRRQRRENSEGERMLRFVQRVTR